MSFIYRVHHRDDPSHFVELEFEESQTPMGVRGRACREQYYPWSSYTELIVKRVRNLSIDQKTLCEGCALNGKQPPYSDNPLTVCMWHGGFYPAFHIIEGSEQDMCLIHCDSYRSVKELLRKQEAES